MATKEDVERIRQQINIEGRKAQEAFMAKQEIEQAEAQKKASKIKERDAKFKELGVVDLFKTICDEGMVDRGTVYEQNSDLSLSVYIYFNHRPSGSTNYDDYYDLVSAELCGNRLQILGNYIYQTDLSTRLANGNFLWTKMKRVYRGLCMVAEPFEASILEVVGKTTVDPKSCGGGYNNY